MTRNLLLARIGWLSLAVLSVAALNGTAHAQATGAPAGTQATGPAVDREALLQEFNALAQEFDAAYSARDGGKCQNLIQQLYAAYERYRSATKDGSLQPAYMERRAQEKSLREAFPSVARLDAELSASEADADAGNIEEVNARLRAISGLLDAARPALTDDRALAVARRIDALKTKVVEWKTARDEQARQEKLESEIRAELAQFDSDLIRAEKTGDPDAAETRIAAVLKGLDAAEAKAAALRLVPTDRVKAQIAKIRADAANARRALVAQREETRARLAIDAAQASLEDLPPAGVTVESAERCASLVGEARVAAEAAKSAPAEVRKRLDDAIRRLELRLSQIRATIQEEGASQRFEEAMEKCDDETLKAESLIGQGASRDDLDRASGLLAGAEAALRAAAEDPTPVRSPSASRANEARLKRSAGRIEAGRRRIDQLRNSLDLADALIAARGHMASLQRALWAGDVATINGLVGKPGVTAAQAAEAQMVLKDLNSHGAFYPSIEDDCQAIEADINSWRVLAAQEKLDKLIKRADSDEFSDAHKAFIRGLCGRFAALIRQLWTIIVLLALAVVLLVVSLAQFLRRGSGSASVRVFGSQLLEARRKLAERQRDLQHQSKHGTAAEQVSAADRLRRVAEAATSPFVPAIRGARMPRALWTEVYSLVLQLTAAGDGATAQKLLQLATSSGILPKSPWVGRDPWYARNWIRLSNGSRAAEAAFAWGEVWRSSSDLESKKVADAEVVRWYEVSVQWLDRDSDVWVLYRRARHERDLGRLDVALDLLVKREANDRSGLSAESRFEGRRSSVPRELKARILLLAAQVKLDQAGIVSLEPLPFRSTLAEWPTQDPQRATSPGAASQYAGVPAQPAVRREPTPLESALQLARRAYDEIGTSAQATAMGGWGNQPGSFGPSSPVGATTMPPAGVSAPLPEPSRIPEGAEREQLLFRWALASFRHALGTSISNAEEILQRDLLREQAATSYGSIQFGPDGASLDPSWSQLEGAKRGQLSAEDCIVLRELRLSWVRWCISRANDQGILGSEDRNNQLRQAAWLVCRYLLNSRADDSLSDVERELIEHRLREQAFRLLDIAPNSQSAPGPRAWAPRDEQDHRIHGMLLRFVNVEVGDPWFVELNQKLRELIGQTWPWQRDFAGQQRVLVEIRGALESRLRQASPDEKGRITLVLEEVKKRIVDRPEDDDLRPKPLAERPTNLLVQTLSSEPKRTPADVPPVSSIRIVDPTNSKADFAGDVAWIDYQGGPLKAVGVFGHELHDFYTVPLKPEKVAVDSVFGAGASLIGSMQVLAELTFDGLREMTGEFHVVLSRAPVRSGWGFGGIGSGMGGMGLGLGAVSGPGAPTNPKDRPEWDRIKVPRAARPARGKEPPTEVSPAAIERSLFDISVVIASVSLDASAMPLDPTAQLGGSEAWRHLANFFRTELGVAEKQVREELTKRVGTGTPGIDVSTIQQSLLDVDFIKLLVRQLRLRDAATCHREAELAWSKMDPAVRSAIDRLLRKFAARHKSVLTAAALLRFGIKLDVPPKPDIRPPVKDPVSFDEPQKPADPVEGSVESRRGFMKLHSGVTEGIGGGRQWNWAKDRGTLRSILGDMQSACEQAKVATPDLARKARLEALIDLIGRFRETYC